MNTVFLYVVVQVFMIFGVAGLLWPEKMVSVFDVLMFPWPASHKTVRNHAWGAIVLSCLLVLNLAVR
jgi:hypothetical protein